MSFIHSKIKSIVLFDTLSLLFMLSLLTTKVLSQDTLETKFEPLPILSYDSNTGFGFGIWNSLDLFNIHNWHSNAVFGLRYYMDTYVVRFDIGISKETVGIYFNFGHIF